MRAIYIPDLRANPRTKRQIAVLWDSTFDLSLSHRHARQQVTLIDRDKRPSSNRLVADDLPFQAHPHELLESWRCQAFR